MKKPASAPSKATSKADLENVFCQNKKIIIWKFKCDWWGRGAPVWISIRERASGPAYCAATGDTENLSVMKPCIRCSLSLSPTLRKTAVAPCLLIRAVYLFWPNLATFNTGTMETRGENGITELKWRHKALICSVTESLLSYASNFIRAVVNSAWFESWLTYKHTPHTHTRLLRVSGIDDNSSTLSLVYFVFQLCFWRSSRQLFMCKYNTPRGKKTLSLEVCCCKNRKTLVLMSLKVRSETAAEPEPPSAPGEPKACVLSLLCVFMCVW